MKPDGNPQRTHHKPAWAQTILADESLTHPCSSGPKACAQHRLHRTTLASLRKGPSCPPWRSGNNACVHPRAACWARGGIVRRRRGMRPSARGPLPTGASRRPEGGHASIRARPAACAPPGGTGKPSYDAALRWWLVGVSWIGFLRLVVIRLGFAVVFLLRRGVRWCVLSGGGCLPGRVIARLISFCMRTSVVRLVRKGRRVWLVSPSLLPMPTWWWWKGNPPTR